jgi:hypothetical protein
MKSSLSPFSLTVFCYVVNLYLSQVLEDFFPQVFNFFFNFFFWGDEILPCYQASLDPLGSKDAPTSVS